MARSRDGVYQCVLPNYEQTPAERRDKYAIAKLHYPNDWDTAQRLRDWRWTKIYRFLQYDSFEDMILALSLDWDYWKQYEPRGG